LLKSLSTEGFRAPRSGARRRFDRFARSVKHLVGALETFRSLNIGFVSLQEQLDTATPIGQAMFTIVGAMAQLERDIIRERVKAGIERAKARGIRLGRPRAAVATHELVSLRAQGLSSGEIARRLGCSRSTVRRYLAMALAPSTTADENREGSLSVSRARRRAPCTGRGAYRSRPLTACCPRT
jgi:DNA invertase Pin-like site-specific DNA recombinase